MCVEPKSRKIFQEILHFPLRFESFKCMIADAEMYSTILSTKQANYTCSCPDGFKGAELGNCTDIDECENQAFECPHGGRCVNTEV